MNLKTSALSVLFLVLGVNFTPFSRAATNEPACKSYHSPLLQKNVEYCVDRTTPDQAPVPGEPVVYFMHGKNGSAKTWITNGYAAGLEQIRVSGVKLKPMTFVSFNTSRYSFFVDNPHNVHAAYETWFTKEFIPFFESTYSICNQKKCRGIMGESMGGFGALKTALRYPDQFSAVAVESPALAPFDIYQPLSQWLKFFQTKPVGATDGFTLIEVVRHLIPNDTVWAEQDPIQLSSALSKELYPPLYLDMGGKDKYGFNVGYGILKGILDARGIPYTTQFEPGAGHDMWKRHAKETLQFMMDHVAVEQF